MTLASILHRLVWPNSPGAFRLWLALVVVFHHVMRIEVGKAPVLVFFALSGFWVHRVWQEQYAQTRWAWCTFMVSRWWRIAPILILSSILCIGLQWWISDADLVPVSASAWQQAVCAVTVLGYALLPTRPVGPAWSLDIEMQFYLIAPLLCALVRRASPVLVLASGFTVFLAAMAFGAGVTLPSFLPFFLIGMVAAEKRWSPPPALAHGGLGLAIGMTTLACLLPLGREWVIEGGSQTALFNLALGMLAIPFAFMTVTKSGDRTDAMLADQSYLVYMFHWPAISLLRHLVWNGPLARGGGVVVLLGMVIVFCGFVWHRLDRPLNRLRKNWVNSRRTGAKSVRAFAKGGDTRAFFA